MNVSASMEEHLWCTHPLQLLHYCVSVTLFVADDTQETHLSLSHHDDNNNSDWSTLTTRSSSLDSSLIQAIPTFEQN